MCIETKTFLSLNSASLRARGGVQLNFYLLRLFNFCLHRSAIRDEKSCLALLNCQLNGSIDNWIIQLTIESFNCRLNSSKIGGKRLRNNNRWCFTRFQNFFRFLDLVKHMWPCNWSKFQKIARYTCSKSSGILYKVQKP